MAGFDPRTTSGDPRVERELSISPLVKALRGDGEIVVLGVPAAEAKRSKARPVALPTADAASLPFAVATLRAEGASSVRVLAVDGGSAVAADVDLDPAAVEATKGTVELAVASIKTNVDLRDEHLRGPDWLDAAKYPKIKFAITKVSGASALKPGEAADLKIQGKVTMHGVTRDETATAKVRWSPTDGAKVTAQFKVNLTNYKISVPSLVRLKVSDEIALNVMLKIKPKSGG